MKLISWNVNGMNAVLKKGLLDFMKNEDADVYCFQETKLTPEKLNLQLMHIPNYKGYWTFSKIKKGYSGTAIYTKTEPIKVTKGIGVEEFDQEGRVITAEFENFYLVTAYFPNANRELSRLGYKLKFNKAWEEFIKNLEKTKPVIMCGDLNVVHTEIDIKRFKENEGNAGVTIQERQWFDKWTSQGYIDTFRLFEKEKGHYTYWSYLGSAREKNIGWRIDYFVISQAIKYRVQKSYILKDQMGSDHCPIVLKIN